MLADRLDTLLTGATTADEEREILTILRGASAEELDAWLTPERADRLFRDVDDRLVGDDNRTTLLRLLVGERHGELGTTALASLVYALQTGHTSDADEQAILTIFRGRRGNDLTALKNEINNRTDQHDLEGLVFVDIDDDATREAILLHFANDTGLTGQDRAREIKVLSDIDDTAISAIHEKRWPRGTVIPGILAFYEALDQGPRDAPRSTGDLTFVTARPGDAFGLIENRSRDSLRKAGIAHMSVLTGSVLNLHSKDAMADRKMGNIDHYRRLYPEYDVVFIGDSGQGDILVGERMLAAHPETVRSVFIHDVVAMPQEERDRLRDKRIHVVDTYVGAGIVARELGLISEKGLRRIVDESRTAFDHVAFTDDIQKGAAGSLLETDIARAGL